MKQPKQNKLSTNFIPELYTVVGKKGTMKTASSQRKDDTITINISHFKKFPLQKESATDSYIDKDNLVMPNRPEVQAEAVIPRYPVRERRNVKRYGQTISET